MVGILYYYCSKAEMKGGQMKIVSIRLKKDTRCIIQSRSIDVDMAEGNDSLDSEMTWA